MSVLTVELKPDPILSRVEAERVGDLQRPLK